MRLPEISKRSRLYVLIAMLVVQTALFLIFLRGGPSITGDNFRYEEGGYAIASGRGLALPYTMSPDPDVQDWVCSRHADACTDGRYPSAQYPPGYQIFIAGIYTVAGRSLWAIEIAHLILLWGLFTCFEQLAAKFLPRVGYWFAAAVATTYPFLARQATLIMADHLHTFLLVASITALLLMKPGLRRGILFGFLFGAATFVRTYSIVIIPFLFGWPRLKRAFSASRKEWITAFAVCVVPFVIWTARNAYWFGRFIPFSTTGLGAMVYLNKLEAQTGEAYDEQNAKKIYGALFRDGEDPANYKLNKTLAREGLAWMKDHPGTVALQVASRVPRLWISKGESRKGISPLYPLLIVYMGGLLFLGLGGMWLKRRDDRWKAVMLIIFCYWGFLLHTPAEARRTLPLRLPMLVFAGFAVEEGVRRWRERRTGAPTALPAAE
jgi:4-amino-4-deoxy-L-arabinose transferase-like glycosyltransferase